jgi:maleylpyruvate isomerase
VPHVTDHEVLSVIERVRAAHERLDRTLATVDDDVARRPSLLPGWTVGHLLTHVARHADSVVRRIEASARGEVVDQYDGGMPGRVAGIEEGAPRPAAELVADVRASSQRLEAAAESMPPEAWSFETRAVSGDLQPALLVLARREREVEVHHADLGLGYGPMDWPASYVEVELPVLLATLAARTDPAQLLAWAMGRAEPPTLRPW